MRGRGAAAFSSGSVPVAGITNNVEKHQFLRKAERFWAVKVLPNYQVRPPTMNTIIFLKAGTVLCSVYVNCALLGYCAASSCKFLTDVSEQHMGPIFRGQEPLKTGPIGLPETSVRNYHYTLRNNPQVLSSLLPLWWSLKSCIREV